MKRPRKGLFIVKIQRPLGGNDPAQPWFIYDKSQLFSTLIPSDDVPPEIKDEVGSDLKAYFLASIKNNSLVIGKRVEDQYW